MIPPAGRQHLSPLWQYWGNVNPIGIRSCYDEGKRVAETLCMDYHRQNKVDIRIIRIFNTYGPNMHPQDGRVVSNFIMQALQNKNITIYGNGKQTRSFQYVDDLVEGMIKMMNSRKEFIGPVNVGNPGEFTIKELAENPAVTVLVSSHDLQHTVEVCNRIVALNKGEVVKDIQTSEETLQELEAFFAV